MDRTRLDIDLNVNMDLNELFKSTFGDPIIDVTESLEVTIGRLFKKDIREGQEDIRVSQPNAHKGMHHV